MSMQEDGANGAPEPPAEPKDEARRLSTAANPGHSPEGGRARAPRPAPRAQLAAAALAALSIVAIGVSAAFLIVPGQESGDGRGAPVASEAAGPDAAASPAQAPGADEGGAEQGAADAQGAAKAAASGPAGGAGPEAPQDASGQPAPSDAGPASPPPAASRPDTVSVQVSVDSSAVGGPVAGSATATFQPGATPYDALAALGLSVNASEGPLGVYVAAIGGLAEKEHGATSGWKYSVNGETPSAACNAYTLSDGDSVVWYYALSA